MLTPMQLAAELRELADLMETEERLSAELTACRKKLTTMSGVLGRYLQPLPAATSAPSPQVVTMPEARSSAPPIRRSYRPGTDLAAILELVATGGRMTMAAIIETIHEQRGSSRQALAKAVQRLTAEGGLKRVDRGVYTLVKV